MKQIVKYLSLLVTLLIPTLLHAETFGSHISIERIEVSSSTTIPAGATVNFLGIIDVKLSVAPSGRLATFTYNDQIFNADATLFYQPTKDSSFKTYPARALDDGNSASICTIIASRGNGDSLTFADEAFARYFEIKKDNQVVDGYTVTQPKDILSWKDSENELCITGLEHSTLYEVTLLPGLVAKRQSYSVILDQPISFRIKTPSMKPTITVDGSKSILTNSENAVIPIEYVNVNEIEISLHKVDLASLTSYGSVFKILDGYDIMTLSNFWGDVLTKKTIKLDNLLNQKRQLNINFSDLIGPNERGLFVATFTSPDLDTRDYQNQPTQWFSISDMSIQIFNGLNTTDIFVHSFENTNSVDGARIEIIAKNNRELFNGTSANGGRISVPNNLLSGTGGFKPEFLIATSDSFGTSILRIPELKQKPRFLNGGEIKRHTQDVYLTTDRETYRAGETVNVFGVIRQLNLDVIEGQEFLVKLLDRNGDKINGADLALDNFGAFEFDIELGENFQLGKYIVQVEGVDEEVLARHSITIEDFVPLTIDPTMKTDHEIWSLNATHKIQLSGDYYSGGPAAGLKGSISTYVKTVNKLGNLDFEDFIFGNGTSTTIAALEEFESDLDEDGQMSATLFTDFNTKASQLYEVLINGTVFDVGGRANTTRLNIPLDTANGYIGIRPDFDEYIDEGVAPSFTIANVNREGQPLGFDAVSYSIQRIYYDYSWNYNNGWRWNRVRMDSETVEAGLISDSKLVVKTPLNWGRYEIIVSNKAGFNTVSEFYVGWGANAQPASEPEEIALTYTNGALRGNAGYSGTLSVLVADEDIVSVKTFPIEKGGFELSVQLPDVSEPGVHLLVSLMRPIKKGSEHLPQISLGKTWVPTASPERNMDLSISLLSHVDSATPISVTVDSTSKFGSAKIFVIDDGIQALTGYENKNLIDHFLGERALNYGIITNFGQLISQDLTLSAVRVGGDGDMLSAAASVDKSEFFKTVTLASPLLDIQDGTAEFTFPATMEWEGRLRVVAFGVDDKGFGFSENYVTVQDPVSIDVSMPRFVTPTDTVFAKVNVRWNDFKGPIELTTQIQDIENTIIIAQPETNAYELELPISVRELGRIPVSVAVMAGGRDYSRNYSLVSRSGSYPVTELSSTKVEKKNWLSLGSVQVQPYNSLFVDLDAPGSEFSISLTPSLGVNLNQVVSELNRYPYGCVEQVSSKTRGLIALSKVRGVTDETSQKIQAGIDRLLAKQKFSGAFGYWDRNSVVYERFQPYAVDTLQKSLPYANNKEQVVDAINDGLEYLYRTSFDDQNTKLYAYGLLAKAGYEITSRARYSIDQELKIGSMKVSTTAGTLSTNIDDLTLAYWVSANLNDTKRMLQISNKAQSLLNQIKLGKPISQLAAGSWVSPNQTLGTSGLYAKSSLNYAHLLTDLSADQIAPVFETIIANTHEYLARQQYRSTHRSAKLVTLQQHKERSLAGTSVDVDGAKYELDSSGSLPISLEQLARGFKVSHNASSSLYLNVKSTGQRRGVKAQNNGYQVQKWWYDQKGDYVDLTSGVLPAKQGNLYTVVIAIDRRKSGSGSDLLVTDLLPAGFEIEKAVLGDPKVGGVMSATLDFSQGKSAYYTAAMDDRFIAHFNGRWYKDSFAYVRYTVRAAYETNAIIPDAVVEEMYSPEVNGRSEITESIVSGR
jgi:uncharacterized protein YfaS (alpha-2-macroglobulin family)